MFDALKFEQLPRKRGREGGRRERREQRRSGRRRRDGRIRISKHQKKVTQKMKLNLVF
jgi:hypothetical protein